MSAQLQPIPLQDVELIPMELSDLALVMRIESAAYSHPWTQGNFVDSLNAGYTLMCAWRSLPGVLRRRELIGYYVTMPVMDEVHLLNLTVSPAHQGLGLGRWLLGEVHASAQQSAASAVWLEVRPSNASALTLYAHYGFKIVGRRRDYYPAMNNSREDALVLKLPLGDEGAQT